MQNCPSHVNSPITHVCIFKDCLFARRKVCVICAVQHHHDHQAFLFSVTQFRQFLHTRALSHLPEYQHFVTQKNFIDQFFDRLKELTGKHLEAIQQSMLECFVIFFMNCFFSFYSEICSQFESPLIAHSTTSSLFELSEQDIQNAITTKNLTNSQPIEH